ncbi:MAG: hypothetical protein IT427_00815 [Pirellulales bacterium]|nr:hypothetical protein [Pirellulales bacterium]
MIPQRVILGLVAGAVGLPIVICVLLGLSHLLAAMNDQSGASAIGRLCLAAGAIWTIDLVALLVALAIDSLGRRN